MARYAPTLRARLETIYTLTSDADSIADARRYVREALADRAHPRVLSEVELVVSELVTNAVCHGPGGAIYLRLTEHDGVIAGEVEDQGDGAIEIRDQDLHAVDGGLGLPIVDRLTTDWGVYPGSTHVWFRFDP
jgi:anti-sigma regulatory factor (Ser/Thr protein kinase)